VNGELSAQSAQFLKPCRGVTHKPELSADPRAARLRNDSQFPNGIVSSVSFVSTTNTARSLTGFVSLALALTPWRSPGSSEKLTTRIVQRKRRPTEAFGHTRMPFAGFRPDHRAGIELTTIDEEELADWRAGRNAVYQLAALTIGARLAVADG
jgi:hypothetical protein